jgi:hypothetical protein
MHGRHIAPLGLNLHFPSLLDIAKPAPIYAGPLTFVSILFVSRISNYQGSCCRNASLFAFFGSCYVQTPVDFGNNCVHFASSSDRLSCAYAGIFPYKATCTPCTRHRKGKPTLDYHLIVSTDVIVEQSQSTRKTRVLNMSTVGTSTIQYEKS